MDKIKPTTISRLLCSLVAILIFSFLPKIVLGQTVIFSDNFETGPYTLPNISTSGTNQWLVKIVSGASTDRWAIGNYAANSKGLTIYSQRYDGYAVYDKDRTTNQIAYHEVDATTFKDLRIDFRWKCAGEKSGNNYNDYGEIVYSTDGGNNWITVTTTKYCNNGSGSMQSVSGMSIPAEVNGTHFYIGFRWRCNNNSKGQNPPFTVDDIVIKGTLVLPPSLTVSSTMLSFGFTPSGTIAPVQSFDIGGSNLTPASGSFTVSSSSSAFEVSRDGTSWSSSVNISYTNETLGSAPVYVRFKPSTANANYTGNITISGGGALMQTVAVNGTSIPPSPVYYSYKSGSWSDFSTWTHDPSGTTQVGSTIPGTNDYVVILSNRSVTLPADVATSGLNVTINDGGILDLGVHQFTSVLNTLRGQGMLRLGSESFPSVTSNSFVLTGGGTAEYYNVDNITLPETQATYNNLNINLAAGKVATQKKDLALNGSLLVKSGTFRINDSTSTVKLNLTVAGDVTVSGGAGIGVGRGTTNSAYSTSIMGGSAPFLSYYENFHRVVIYGSLYNNGGTVKFTNLSKPSYNSFPPLDNATESGAATVYFMGSSNTTLLCNGVTNFYNLVLDKVDPSFSLTVDPSAPKNFVLFGANTSPFEASMDDANPNIKKALWVRTGSLVLKGACTIPSLSEGTTDNSDYFIPQRGSLVLDGPDVVVLSTADSYLEVNVANGTTAGSDDELGVVTNRHGSLGILGRVQVNDGYLSTRESAGISYWSYGSGQLIVNGGVVDTKQIADGSGSNAGLFNYTQNGGVVHLRGRMPHKLKATVVDDLTLTDINSVRAPDSISEAQGTFAINGNSSTGFTMNGGEIRIYDACTTGDAGAFMVECPKANISVTGGMLSLIPTSDATVPANDAANFLVSTTAPLGSLAVAQASGNTGIKLSSNIYLLKHLNLKAGVLNANGKDVYVGGDFTIENGTTYTPNGNRTVFNGTGNQLFTINVVDPLSIYRLKVDKLTAESELKLAGTQKVINISDSLSICKGKLNDNGTAIKVSGSIYNSGTHYGVGRIVLNGSEQQSLDGNGSGMFGNLEMNSSNPAPAPISFTASATVNGTLTFTSDRQLSIGSSNLTMAASASFIGAGVGNRFIRTSGQAGDGGLTIVYSAARSTNTFYVGTTSTSHPTTAAYTPVNIGFSAAPATFGSVTLRPVGYEHPATTTKGQSLTYFWNIKSAGFSGIVNGSITHSFTYSTNDVVGNSYVPAFYNRQDYTWNSGATANISSNVITDWAGIRSSLDGDYTAGTGSPTSSFGVPKKYYSRINGLNAGSGLWSDKNTWSTDNSLKHAGPAATTIPGLNDIVIIGGKDSVYLKSYTLKTTIIDPFLEPYFDKDEDLVYCASLKIEKGSALDIQNNPGSNLGIVLSHENGNGNFRVTTRPSSSYYFDDPCSFVFPSGDFSDYNANGGTTEFYTVNPQSGTIMILPNNANSYGNVILSPLGGSNIIFPNISNITIQGNLITRGQDWRSWLAMTWDTDYGTIIPKRVYVKGNMHLQGGTFIFVGNSNVEQRITIDGNVVVYPGAGIDVFGSSYKNYMAIGGSLINNSNDDPTYDLEGHAGSNVRFYVSDTRKCDVTFFGNSNTTISNTGTTPTTGSTPKTIFGKVSVNKGSSQATTLTCSIGGTLTTPDDDWLTLQNGTLIYSSPNDLSITTETPFVIPNTAGLVVNTDNTVNLAQGAVSSNTVLLNGKLTIDRGTVNVGNAGNTDVSNSVEYSSGGGSEIQITGGTLNVNGQIRRNPLNAAGILGYTQSGGVVKLYGNKKADGSNATLEILNEGSWFNMSGDSRINIINGGGGGNAFGDLYLRPANGSVTGGTITLGANSTQTYKIDASVPLNNLTINGSGGANTVNLMVNPLILNGTLTLGSASSILKANGVDVTIKGDLVNNGVPASYDCGANTTTFNGGVQSISGSSATNVGSLIVNPITSLTFSKDFTVRGNLSILSGTLICGSGKLNLKGNLINNGKYTDTNGGIILNSGTTQHQISGTGTFGNLELDNALGARVQNSLTLESNLKMTRGILDINRYLLGLGLNSNIVANGTPFGVTKMITSDGVFSNVGIQKVINIGASTFTFPLGAGGKYTPIELIITANGSVAKIRINNINERHPSVLDPKTAEALKYYWEVENSALSGFGGSLKFNYNQDDVVGDESKYVATKLVIPGYTWSKSPSSNDNVLEADNTISFTFPTGTTSISGEYTAGADSAFPPVVATYTSIKDGDWSDKTIWSPEAPDGGPNGFIVIVNNTVTARLNNTFAYRTQINGKLKIDPATYGHSLGTVTGNGTLYLENGLLPAGRYDSFFDCSGNATLEYGGDGNYTIISDLYSSVPNLILSGRGVRYYPNKNLTICKKLDINGPILDNDLYSKRLTILGEMQLSAGGFRAGTGDEAIVSFAGTAKQKISTAANAFKSPNNFNSIEINNPSGLELAGQLEMSGKLHLANGVINTTSVNTFTITNPSESCIIPAAGSETSYINGPLTKMVNTGDYDFIFPVGADKYGYQISLRATFSDSFLWTVEYFGDNPTNQSFNDPLQVVNSDEFWRVSVPTNAKGYVKLGWDPSSGLTPPMTVNGIGDMRIADFRSAKWNSISTTTTGDNSYGAVRTANNYEFNGGTTYDFTTASITAIRPKAKLSPTGAICGSSSIPVSIFSNGMSLTPPFSLSYTLNGTPQPSVNFITTTYSLPVNQAGIYKLVSFTYNNGLSGVVDSKTAVTSYDNPTVANAGVDQKLCGATEATLAGNSPSVGKGLWTIVSGIGGTFSDATQSNSTISGPNGSLYTARWTINNGGCISFDDVDINLAIKPSAPDITSPQHFCSDATLDKVKASVDSGTELRWYDAAVEGTSLTASTEKVVDSKTYYAEAYNGCTSDGRTSVTTSIIPDVTASAIIDESGTQPGCEIANEATSTKYSSTITNSTSYSWSVDNTAAGIIDPVTGLMTWKKGFVGSVNIKVEASGCGPVASQVRIVEVNPLPLVPELSEVSTCAGDAPTLGVTNAQEGYAYQWSVSTTGYSIYEEEKSSAKPVLHTPSNDDLFPSSVSELESYPDVTVVVTSKGCSSSATNSDSNKRITIHRIPRTGPPYHIGNSVSK